MDNFQTSWTTCSCVDKKSLSNLNLPYPCLWLLLIFIYSLSALAERSFYLFPKSYRLQLGLCLSSSAQYQTIPEPLTSPYWNSRYWPSVYPCFGLFPVSPQPSWSGKPKTRLSFARCCFTRAKEMSLFAVGFAPPCVTLLCSLSYLRGEQSRLILSLVSIVTLWSCSAESQSVSHVQ